MELLTQLLSATSSGPLLRILGALLILVFGHMLVKATGIALRRLYRLGAESGISAHVKRERIGLLTNLMDVGVIVLSLGYLNVGLGSQIQATVIQQAPRLFSAFLIGVLGVIVINMAEKALKDLFRTLGVKKYLREAGMSSGSFDIVSLGMKIFLYLILVQVVLYQLNFNIVLINQALNAFLWAFAFLLAAIAFYSVKDLFRNIGAGFYLKNSRTVRPGEEVEIDGDRGEVKDVSFFGTTLETRDGFTVLKPNGDVLESSLRFKRAKSDLETLEMISSYFQIPEPEQDRAATIRAGLDIFGVEVDSEEVEEALSEHETEEAVEEVSDGRVKAAWISSDKISSLEDEYKAWFSDGAVLVSRFDKQSLFSESEPGNHTLSIGVENGDILNLDFVASSSGSVYYVDAERMSELMSGDDGYLVLAPQGTTAYWRIKKEIVYADKDLYESLSKTLENKLGKIIRQGRMLEEVSSEHVKKYVEKWGEDVTASKLWTPSGGEKNEDSGDN